MLLKLVASAAVSLGMVGLGTPAAAAEFYLLSANDNQIVVADRLQVNPGRTPNQMRGWVIYIRRSFEIQGEAVGYTSSLQEFDCVNRQFRTISMQFHRLDGSLINGSDQELAWMHVEPDTMGDAALQFACLQATSVNPFLRLGDGSALSWMTSIRRGPWPTTPEAQAEVGARR